MTAIERRWELKEWCKDVPVKEMSLQQARAYWAYLQDQAELKLKRYIDAPRGSPYKDEARAEAETYERLARIFAKNFEQPIAKAEDIPHGLTAEQAASFLNYLDEEIAYFNSALEEAQSKRAEALAKVQEADYSRVKSIYKLMTNQDKDRILILEHSRERFTSILQDG